MFRALYFASSTSEQNSILKHRLSTCSEKMTAFSSSPTKSRKLRSFVAVVFLNVLLYMYIGTPGNFWSNFDGVEPWIADALTCQRTIYLASRLSYHPNSTASLNLPRLALCGDINPNPGLDTSNKTKSKCKTCERTIARNH